MGGKCAKRNNKKDITAQFIKDSYVLDDEMKALLQDYIPPVINPGQQQAALQWRNKSAELYQLLEQLPVEELSSVIKTLHEELNIVDATASVREAFIAFSEELEDEVKSVEVTTLTQIRKPKQNFVACPRLSRSLATFVSSRDSSTYPKFVFHERSKRDSVLP